MWNLVRAEKDAPAVLVWNEKSGANVTREKTSTPRRPNRKNGGPGQRKRRRRKSRCGGEGVRSRLGVGLGCWRWLWMTHCLRECAWHRGAGTVVGRSGCGRCPGR